MGGPKLCRKPKGPCCSDWSGRGSAQDSALLASRLSDVVLLLPLATEFTEKGKGMSEPLARSSCCPSSSALRAQGAKSTALLAGVSEAGRDSGGKIARSICGRARLRCILQQLLKNSFWFLLDASKSYEPIWKGSGQSGRDTGQVRCIRVCPNTLGRCPFVLR